LQFFKEIRCENLVFLLFIELILALWDWNRCNKGWKVAKPYPWWRWVAFIYIELQ